MLDRIVITDVIYVEEKQEGKRLQRSRRSSRGAREARKSRRRRRRLRAPAFLPCQRVVAPGHPMLKRGTRRFSLPVLSLRPAISAGDLVNR